MDLRPSRQDTLEVGRCFIPLFSTLLWRLLPADVGRGRNREIPVEDIVGVVARLELSQAGEGLAGERIIQAFWPLVGVEAEVEASQVRCDVRVPPLVEAVLAVRDG